MSIDLTVVTLERPDWDVCARLSNLVLSTTQPRIEVGGFDVDEVPTGYHEFDGRHVVTLGAVVREDWAYLSMFVAAQSIATLYRGEIVDEVLFFPRTDTIGTLRAVLENGQYGAASVWRSLRASGSSDGSGGV